MATGGGDEDDRNVDLSLPLEGRGPTGMKRSVSAPVSVPIREKFYASLYRIRYGKGTCTHEMKGHLVCYEMTPLLFNAGWSFNSTIQFTNTSPVLVLGKVYIPDRGELLCICKMLTYMYMYILSVFACFVVV